MTCPVRASRVIAWLAFAAYLLAGLLPYQALVLCVDGQGHISIEAATAEGACFDCGPPASELLDRCCSAPGEGEASREACDCSDVVLAWSSSQPHRVFKELASAWKAPAISSCRYELPTPRLVAEAFRDRSPTYGPPGTLRASRSVVLRI